MCAGVCVYVCVCDISKHGCLPMEANFQANIENNFLNRNLKLAKYKIDLK